MAFHSCINEGFDAVQLFWEVQQGDKKKRENVNAV